MKDKRELCSTERSFFLSSQDFRALASARLNRENPAYWTQNAQKSQNLLSPSDFDLNPNTTPNPSSPKVLKTAAVLVPLIKYDTLHVLLTKRTDHLATHAGQISFPGGKSDPQDQNSVSTAIRETQEEIGLNEVHIEPLGFLDTYYTVTGYAISPVVAFIEPGYSIILNTEEVSEVFEVPLAFLMNPANLQMHSKTFKDIERKFYAFSFKEHYIWGATAGIIKNMYEKLFKP